MTQTIIRPSDAKLGIREGASEGMSARTILSAIGHPGYGEKFARRVLAEMADTGCGAHRAIRVTLDVWQGVEA